jgi:cysteine desulfurase family protein (TIGR01976 family)
MTLDLEAIRSQFPALHETDDGLARVYFDNPAGTQVPQRVVDAMSHCMLGASANMGGYFRTSVMVGDIVADAQQAMADFLNAPSADEVVFGQNMTSLTFHVSRSIGRRFDAGDEIILSRMDHDANVEPWALLARDCGLTVRWLPFDTETFEFDLRGLENLLNERTRLVCVCAASNLTGTINDVRAICRMARDAGAWTYIDAVQSAPHMVHDVQDFGCDFLVCSPYKFF